MENPATTKNTASKLETLSHKLQAAHEEIGRLSDLLEEAKRFKTIADNERIERFRELARMAELVLRQDRELARITSNNGWLQQLSSYLLDRPLWWSLLPARRRKRKERKALRRERIFDTQTYCELHPDVKASGIDPLRHYLEHGMDEGRGRSAPRDA